MHLCAEQHGRYPPPHTCVVCNRDDVDLREPHYVHAGRTVCSKACVVTQVLAEKAEENSDALL